MRAIYGDRYRRDDEAYKSFKTLWLVDDPAWVEKRKKEWALICDGRSSHALRFLGRYYVYGEEIPDYIEGDGISDRDILSFSFSCRLAYTPFTSTEQLQSLWDVAVGIGHRHDDHGMVRDVEVLVRALPDHSARIKLIANSLFCDRYFNKTKQGKRRLIWLSIKPSDFVFSFSKMDTLRRENETLESDFRCFSIEYFLRCLNLVDAEAHRSDLIEMYRVLLSKEGGSLSCYFLELKNKLISIAGNGESEILMSAYQEAL